MGKPDQKRKPRAKTPKTMANAPNKRAYLCGTTGLEKKFLIVDVTEKRCPENWKIIDEVKAALESEHLTKAEARATRERLCSQHGCYVATPLRTGLEPVKLYRV